MFSIGEAAPRRSQSGDSAPEHPGYRQVLPLRLVTALQSPPRRDGRPGDVAAAGGDWRRNPRHFHN
jgi:hypothetical protein